MKLLALGVAFTIAACGTSPRQPVPTIQGVAPAAPAPQPRFASFWTEARHRAWDPTCGPRDFAAAPAPGDPPAARADAWARILATCALDSYAPDGTTMAVYRDFATALLEAGYAHDCNDVLTPFTTPYAEHVEIEPRDPRMAIDQELLDLDETCRAAHDAQRSAFAAPECPGPHCYELVEDPRNPPRTAQDPTSYGQCVTVRRGATTLLASDGPLRDDSFCCEIDSVAVAPEAGTDYLRIRGGGRECAGGTASEEVDAIYRVDGDRLVLEVDDSLVLH